MAGGNVLSHNPRLFRQGALIAYWRRRNDVRPAPHPRSRRIFLLLWLAAGLSAASDALVLSARLPVHAAGTALRFAAGSSAPESAGADLLVCLPAEKLPRLKTGQRVLLAKAQAPGSAKLRGEIVHVFPEAMSADRLARRFTLRDGPPDGSAGMRAVAGARLDRSSRALMDEDPDPSAREALVEIGVERLFAALFRN